MRFLPCALGEKENKKKREKMRLPPFALGEEILSQVKGCLTSIVVRNSS